MLEQAIMSFMKQDYENKEMIIVDDGSITSCKHVIPDTPMVKYIRKDNGGCPSAINMGITNSDSDLVCVLGDDDMLNGNESLSVRAEYLKHCEVIYTSAIEINEQGEQTNVYPASAPSDIRIWNEDYINIHTMMWHRSIHKKIGYFEEDMLYNEDWEFKIKCLMECKVKAIDFYTVKYRRWHGMKSMKDRHAMGKCKEVFMARLKRRYNKPTKSGLEGIHDSWGHDT